MLIMATHSVCTWGGRVYQAGLSRAEADRVLVECSNVYGRCWVVPDRADSCRGCGRVTDQVGRLCVRCEHAEDDARDADSKGGRYGVDD